MGDRVGVTSDNFGELLIQGLKEAIAIERGERKAARVSRRKFTARSAAAKAPPRYSKTRIIRLRRRYGVSQAVFAGMLNVSRSTVCAWEQGHNEPDGATRRLLEVAERHPEVLLEPLKQKRSA
ncbi:MAG: helix-turn-helix domain-containing protein [Gemmatimonadota bacterium]